MESYIKKADIIAEINRIKKEECPTDSYEGRCKLLWFEQFLSFINTLEVKEINSTDAFIEKAEDFIRRKICDYIVHYNYGPNNDMETMYIDSRFFEDFKNYIKENKL